MAEGTLYHQYIPHCHGRSIAFGDQGAGDLLIGKVPPCRIVDLLTVKSVDFDGTSPALDVGTTADQNGLLSAYDLSSSTALGPIRQSFIDNAQATISTATSITATLDGTGSTAGEVAVYVFFYPDENLTTV